MSKRPDIGPFGGAGLSHEEHHAQMFQDLQDDIRYEGNTFSLVLYFLELCTHESIAMRDKFSYDFRRPIDKARELKVGKQLFVMFPNIATGFGCSGPAPNLRTAVSRAIEYGRYVITDGKLMLSDNERERVKEELIPRLSKKDYKLWYRRSILLAEEICELRAELEES